MDPRIAFFIILGFGLMIAVGLERILVRKSFLSVPIFYVFAGWALFSLPLNLPQINPLGSLDDAKALEYVTEFIVIVSLMGAGIAIDRPVTWPNWRQIWPLLVVAMPVTIFLVALYGWWMLGFAPASAILLGACLAPTDPVLARSVQVGPPGEDERHDIRFSLTVEAGLNDGLAFPFIHLAIAAIGMTAIGGWTLHWFAEDFVWRILAGSVVGYAVGRAGAWYVFERKVDEGINDIDRSIAQYSTSEGLVVLGTLLLAYGLAELAHGYGFLAVFIGAVTARQQECKHRYHKVAHHFIDQIEKIVLVIVLFGFGGMLASGIISNLSWQEALLGLLLVFVFRPIAGLMAEGWSNLPWRGTLAVAFLGIRGMGSIYYLSYAQNNGYFQQLESLWATVVFAILVSIVVHGITTTQLMRGVERRGEHIYRGSEAKWPRRRPELESEVSED